MGFLFQFTFLVLLGVALTADTNDLVTNLPGLSQMPVYKQYSGYLDASDTKHLHYWFVESQNNPATDPVILWLNGGPGCSSLDGFLSENGPLHVREDGKTLYSNQYSWNKLANVVYIEAPAGVGYSYDDKGNVATNDDEVSKHNYAALIDFFKKFPEFSKNPFYITGESYGGIYIPTLAVRIIDANSTINFKGIAVGNGLSSYKLNDNSLVFFAYYHGLVGDVLWDSLTKHCCSGQVGRNTCSFHKAPNMQCQDAVAEVMQLVYSSGLNEYALYLDCANSNSVRSYEFAMRNLFKKLPFDIRSKIFNRGHKKYGDRDDVPCVNVTAQTNWLNMAEVRKALHIPMHVGKWEICSSKVSMNYGTIYDDMYPQYHKIYAQPGLRTMLYNGDTDMACNFLGDQWFVDSLNLTSPGKHAPWYLNEQVAGFAREFDRVVFTTIRGAGHMVPQWRPAYAYAMIEKFLLNKPFTVTDAENNPK